MFVISKIMYFHEILSLKIKNNKYFLLSYHLRFIEILIFLLFQTKSLYLISSSPGFQQLLYFLHQNFL